jgi:SAM-dependent methyltransferase
MKTNKPVNVTAGGELGELYWNKRYADGSTGWDMGEISPPLKEYIDQLANKNIRILIPGCGNSYEAEYLAKNEFKNITLIDIAPALVTALKKKFKKYEGIKILQQDFFKHTGTYDLILEQTFFCAINPALRKDYVKKANALLAKKGKLVGLLFNREFEQEGPPFGGSSKEYKSLFKPYFTFNCFEACYNSHSKRMGAELFINLVKKVQVMLLMLPFFLKLLANFAA